MQNGNAPLTLCYSEMWSHRISVPTHHIDAARKQPNPIKHNFRKCQLSE